MTPLRVAFPYNAPLHAILLLLLGCGKLVAATSPTFSFPSMDPQPHGSWVSLLVVVPDAVDLVLGVDGEGHPIQTLIADNTAEAARVVRLP